MTTLQNTVKVTDCSLDIPGDIQPYLQFEKGM